MINKKLCDEFKGLTICDSENKRFPYFVMEWGECFSYDEIKERYRDDMDFANIDTEQPKAKVFVLVETDSTDPTWCYTNTFRKREDAVRELHKRYHEDVVEREALVVKSDFTEKGAYAEMVDGITIAWNIKENEIV